MFTNIGIKLALPAKPGMKMIIIIAPFPGSMGINQLSQEADDF